MNKNLIKDTPPLSQPVMTEQRIKKLESDMAEIKNFISVIGFNPDHPALDAKQRITEAVSKSFHHQEQFPDLHLVTDLPQR